MSQELEANQKQIQIKTDRFMNQEICFLTQIKQIDIWNQ